MVKAEKKETVSSQTENRFLKLRKDKEEAAISNKIKQFEAYQELMESRKKSSREKLAKSREILVEDTISVINSVNENDMFTPGSLEFKSEAFADFMADEKGIPVDREETLTWLNTSGEVKRGKVDTTLRDRRRIETLKGWNELYGESKLSLTTYHQILTSKDQRLTCIIGMNQIAILNQDDIMGQKVRIIELEVTFQKGACYCLSPDGNILIYIYGHNLYSIDLLKGKAHTIFYERIKALENISKNG
ncbi:DPP IV N-terminal domain-containing protein [Candidatus Poseidoniales archaeon]|nr:DPP IV N-terminal domain-containing protein [Candidatus Poseidoniales archaeon]